MRNVADTGLLILYQMLQNINGQPEAAQPFFKVNKLYCNFHVQFETKFGYVLQTYYIDILQHMFSVVTDTSHTAGLSMHATILVRNCLNRKLGRKLFALYPLFLMQAYMFTLVEGNKITVYLGPHTQPPNMLVNAANIAFVQEYVANLLKTAFPHLTDNQVCGQTLKISGLGNWN
jgi:exportin-1